MQWKLIHLGGNEMMRDGTKTVKVKSHKRALEVFDEYEVFYETPKQEFQTVVNALVSDTAAFKFLEDAWSERFNDGGGWGELECNDITNLLAELQMFEFYFMDTDS